MVFSGMHEDGALRARFGDVFVFLLLGVGESVVLVELDLSVLLEVFLVGEDDAHSATGDVTETDVEASKITADD